MPRVLFIGGTDSSGGAGLARDIATAAQMGAEACLAVTAVTAQTDDAVHSVRLMSCGDVALQVKAAGEVGAVKVGMLGAAAVVSAVATALPSVPLVLDPVLASSSGTALLDEDGVDTLIAELLPRTTLLTPNLPELGMLAARLGFDENTEEAERVRVLIMRGCGAILVKGGHAEDDAFCEDRLHLPSGEIMKFRGPRFGFPMRGTGCQLASAIAVGLAEGADLGTAVQDARAQVEMRFRMRERSLNARV
ncbi:bifunctional hydroxymethylpyrimidine kinase/phosphomethylpyrimidine kinase [Marivivens aquimaris]|uniref:bifunctional hydroxymethylpyrimidine kinase/phosphomethylpyrimidine kinase n=1 Tax=Marivivens aquimaris TaxID=2774876 RepID=UPI0018806FCE|nr:hydroxymethylpyrimidine/phosphomethylpyrimidine kinase [Marivivens aquimaris]